MFLLVAHSFVLLLPALPTSRAKSLILMVGATGIEPVTPTMSREGSFGLSYCYFNRFLFSNSQLPSGCPALRMTSTR